MGICGDKRPHVLVFPYPAQGHALPLLDLTHQLVLRGIGITVVTTHKNSPALNPLLAVHPQVRSLILPFPSHPSIQQGIENVRELGNAGNLFVVAALSQLHGPILDWFRSHDDPPLLLISDFFLGWTQGLAQEMGIPRVAFFSSGAFFSSVNEYLWNNLESVRHLGVVDFDGFPSSVALKKEHLPSLFRRYRDLDSDSTTLRHCMISNGKSFGYVLNTFEAMEGEYLNYLKQKLGHDRVYAVGPLSLLGPEPGDQKSCRQPASGEDAIRWLDKCSDGSVLYVCFGSQKSMNPSQIHALALGLEKSQLPFVWVLKDDSAIENWNQSRGLVLRGWVPQVAILSHRAVGGFLSHCGWNSVMEAVAAGVLILGWPMEADQFVNARLLEELGLCVRASEGAESVPDSDELAGVLKSAMGDRDAELETKVDAMKDKALCAVRDGGSSYRDLDRILAELI